MSNNSSEKHLLILIAILIFGATIFGIADSLLLKSIGGGLMLGGAALTTHHLDTEYGREKVTE